LYAATNHYDRRADRDADANARLSVSTPALQRARSCCHSAGAGLNGGERFTRKLGAWGAHCVGPDAIASYLRSRPPAVAFDLGPAAVHGDAGLAYAWSPVFVGYQGDQVDTSHQIVILRKNAAGRWRIRLVTLVGSSGNAGATRIATANVMALKRQEDDACPPIPR
jgi:hypothetical protein